MSWSAGRCSSPSASSARTSPHRIRAPAPSFPSPPSSTIKPPSRASSASPSSSTSSRHGIWRQASQDSGYAESWSSSKKRVRFAEEVVQQEDSPPVVNDPSAPTRGRTGCIDARTGAKRANVDRTPRTHSGERETSGVRSSLRSSPSPSSSHTRTPRTTPPSPKPSKLSFLPRLPFLRTRSTPPPPPARNPLRITFTDVVRSLLPQRRSAKPVPSPTTSAFLLEVREACTLPGPRSSASSDSSSSSSSLSPARIAWLEAGLRAQEKVREEVRELERRSRRPVGRR